MSNHYRDLACNILFPSVICYVAFYYQWQLNTITVHDVCTNLFTNKLSYCVPFNTESLIHSSVDQSIQLYTVQMSHQCNTSHMHQWYMMTCVLDDVCTWWRVYMIDVCTWWRVYSMTCVMMTCVLDDVCHDDVCTCWRVYLMTCVLDDVCTCSLYSMSNSSSLHLNVLNMSAGLMSPEKTSEKQRWPGDHKMHRRSTWWIYAQRIINDASDQWQYRFTA